jgi:membrane protein
MIYKIMPRLRIAWHDVWIGALVTALLFNIGKSLIGLYIGTSGVTSAFGAAGSLVVLLLWVYYSAQIFLLGAEFTWAYAHAFGSLQKGEKPTAAAAIPQRRSEQAPTVAQPAAEYVTRTGSPAMDAVTWPISLGLLIGGALGIAVNLRKKRRFHSSGAR